MLAMDLLTVFAFVVVIGTAIWVGFDAAKRDWVEGSNTAVWVLGTLLLWIVVFPFYLWKRGRVPLKGETVTETRLQPMAATPRGPRGTSVASWVAAVAAAGMAVGALGPWARVLTITVSGLDASSDGWFVLGGAVLAGLGVLLHAGGRGRGWAVLSLLCALAAFAASLYDRSHLRHVTSDAGGLVQVGWGLNLTVFASALLGIASFRLLFARTADPGYAPTTSTTGSSPSAAVAAPRAAAGWYADPLGLAPLRLWSGTAWTEDTTAAAPQAAAATMEPLGAIRLRPPRSSEPSPSPPAVPIEES
jgi:uncharacterized protein DUF2510